MLVLERAAHARVYARTHALAVSSAVQCPSSARCGPARVQMYFDDLPIWGFIGKVEKVDKGMREHTFSFFLFTHFHFDVQYKSDRIISIDSSADPKTVRDISFDGEQEVEFTYSVKWTPTTEKARARAAALCRSGHACIA
jgi:Endomembrane protein 70